MFGRAESDHDDAITDHVLSAICAYFDMHGDSLVDMNECLTQWGDLRLDAPDTVIIHRSD